MLAKGFHGTISLSLSHSIYIYIYRERERERKIRVAEKCSKIHPEIRPIAENIYSGNIQLTLVKVEKLISNYCLNLCAGELYTKPRGVKKSKIGLRFLNDGIYIFSCFSLIKLFRHFVSAYTIYDPFKSIDF